MIAALNSRARRRLSREEFRKLLHATAPELGHLTEASMELAWTKLDDDNSGWLENYEFGQAYAMITEGLASGEMETAKEGMPDPSAEPEPKPEPEPELEDGHASRFRERFQLAGRLPQLTKEERIALTQ